MGGILHQGDCLEIMHRNVLDSSVALIYLDPPFNSGRNYTKLLTDQSSTSFSDVWDWNRGVDDFRAVGADTSPLAVTMAAMYEILGETGDLAYLAYMATSIARMSSGACADWIALSALRSDRESLLENRAGRDLRSQALSRMNSYGSMRHFMGGNAPTRRITTKFFFIRKCDQHHFDWEAVAESYDPLTVKRFDKQDADGRYKIVKGKKFYMKAGTPPNACFTIPQVAVNASEYVDYPTQKPIQLLRRIILASSRPGDTVLDPFCGSGTTLHAAQDAGRDWIGIDISSNAYEMTQKRLTSGMLSSTTRIWRNDDSA